MFLARIVFESNQLYKELKSAQSLAQWLRKQLVEFSGGCIHNKQNKIK